MNSVDNSLIANSFYELGAMRKIMRAHQQRLLTTDPTDTISAHSFRTAAIGLVLASQFEEDVDILKIIIMCLFHDLPEIRSNDHHWAQKGYVKINDLEILRDQLANIPGKMPLMQIMHEYNARETIESIIAKDADSLDQLLLMKEYEQQGNKQASIWLKEANGKSKNEQNLVTKQAKKLARKIRSKNPGDWTAGISIKK